MDDLGLLLVALALPVLVVVAVAAIDRLILDPAIGVAVVTVVYLIDVLFDGDQLVVISGITLTTWDVVASVMIAAAVCRLIREEGHGLGVPAALLVVLAVVLLQSLVRGVGNSGLTTAVNEFREWYRYLAPALYFATVRSYEDVREALERWLVRAAVILTALVVARWASYFTGVPLGPFALGSRAESQAYGGIRVIHANDSLLVLYGAVLAVSRWRRGRFDRELRVAAVFFVVVVGLQHRTTWIAAIVGLLVLFVRDRRIAGRLAALGTAGLVVVVSGLVVTAGPDELSRGDGPSVVAGEGALETNTFLWRYEGWRALVADVEWDSGIQPLLGEPFGAGWLRTVEGQRTEVSPHSGYVTSFLRMGLTGTGALLVLLLLAWLGLQRRGEDEGPVPTVALQAMLAVHAMFIITYDPDPVLGMLLGMALLAGRTRPRSMAAPSSLTTVEVPSQALR